MMTNDLLYIIILLLVIVSYFVIFALGVFIGRSIATNSGVSSSSNPLFISNKAKQETQKLSIDDRKVVIGVSTDGLDKKYDKLGDTQHSNDNISSSINKLKNMKG